MKRKSLPFVILTLSALLAAGNETKTVDFTLDAGKVAREFAPVRVPVMLTDGWENAGKVSIATPDGQTIPGQLTTPSLLSPAGAGSRELVFILPKLKAGESAAFKATLEKGTPSGDQFTWVETPGDNIELSLGSRKVLRYWCKTYDESTPAKANETYKVFHQLYDPTGSRLVNKGPGGKFTHHRGIFYGFNKVEFGATKCDIWHCNKAHQSHGKVLQAEGGPVMGRHRVLIYWNGPDKKPFAEEEREMTIYNTPGGTLLEFNSRLNSKVGLVKVAGDPQHAGFHFRASLDVEEKTEKQTYFIREDGIGKVGETRNWSAKTPEKTTNLAWNAMAFKLDNDKTYTAGYLDHPTNPKEGRYSERTYGRFGSYFETSFDTDKPLTVKYRVWLQEGAAAQELLAAKDADFDEAVKATVK